MSPRKTLFNKNSLLLYLGSILVLVGGGLMAMAHMYESRGGVDLFIVILIRIGAGGWFAAGIAIAVLERRMRREATTPPRTEVVEVKAAVSPGDTQLQQSR